MKRKSYLEMNCPIARSLEEIGEWWSILILRDAFHGLKRFDEFAESLGVAPNILTKRLKTLVDNGLLEKRAYSQKPPRHEYVLTKKGRDFSDVLLTLVTWGNRHVMEDGRQPVLLTDKKTGETIETRIVNAKTLQPLEPGAVQISAGPGATEKTLTRLAYRKKLAEARKAEDS